MKFRLIGILVWVGLLLLMGENQTYFWFPYQPFPLQLTALVGPGIIVLMFPRKKRNKKQEQKEFIDRGGDGAF